MTYKFEPWRSRLREAIVKSGLSQRALSLQAGLKPGYVRDIVAPAPNKKPSDPSVVKLEAICAVLDLTLNDLFMAEDEAPEDIADTMAARGFSRLLTTIRDLPAKEQLWILGGLENQLQILNSKPSARKPRRPPQLKIVSSPDGDS